MNEVWKPIPGYEGYYWMNSKGQVKNSKGKYIAQTDCGGGLFKVKFQAKGQVEEKYVSTLKAELFPEIFG